MPMRAPFLITVILLSFFLNTSGQPRVVDSLRPLLKEKVEPAVEADRLAKMGMGYYYQYVYMDSVFHYSNRSYEIAVKHELREKQGRAIFQIGLAHSFLGSYPEAIVAYHESIALLRPFNRFEQIGSAYNNIGGSYFELSDYEKAIKNYELALEIAVKAKDTMSIGIDNMNIGEAYYKMGMLLPAREKLETALMYLELADYDPPTGHLFYARILDALENTARAKDEALKSLEIAKDKGSLLYISEASQLLAKLYAKEKDYENAYFFQEQFTIFNDSLIMARETNEIEKLQLNFELKEQKDAVASLSLKNKYVNIIYGLVGIGLLLLTILVFRQRKIVRMTRNMHDIQERLVGKELFQRELKVQSRDATGFDAAISDDHTNH